MKRHLIMLWGCCLISAGGHAFAQSTQPATISSNVAVILNVDIKPAGALTLVALNMNRIGGSEFSLETVFANSPLIKNDVPSQADQIALWDENSRTFVRYYQKSNGFFFKIGPQPASPIKQYLKSEPGMLGILVPPCVGPEAGADVLGALGADDVGEGEYLCHQVGTKTG